MGNTTKNTDEKRKTYKKAKKLRRKLRKAEQLIKQGTKENNNTRTEQSSMPKKVWRRVTAEDGAKKAVDRPLEAGYGVDAINDLLQRRSTAKAEKNYDVSDDITKTLVRLQIVYDDDRGEWHTRAWKYPKGM
jgi:cysteinyl-tRNA synthetase